MAHPVLQAQPFRLKALTGVSGFGIEDLESRVQDLKFGFKACGG